MHFIAFLKILKNLEKQFWKILHSDIRHQLSDGKNQILENVLDK